MTAIHYELSDPDRAANPSTDLGQSECVQAMRRAIDIAQHICSQIDEDTSEDPIVTSDRFIIDMHFEGRCRGSEPISNGWTKDFEPPHHWVLRGFCKTVLADDPIRAHLLVSHILHAWQLAGLIDTIHDEVVTCPRGTFGHFSAPPRWMRYVLKWIPSRGSSRMPSLMQSPTLRTSTREHDIHTIVQLLRFVRTFNLPLQAYVLSDYLLMSKKLSRRLYGGHDRW